MRREVLKQNLRNVREAVIVVESGENALRANKEGELWCITLKLWKKAHFYFFPLSQSLSLSLFSFSSLSSSSDSQSLFLVFIKHTHPHP